MRILGFDFGHLNAAATTTATFGKDGSSASLRDTREVSHWELSGRVTGLIGLT